MVIVKQANYTDCLTCYACISDNVYKVYACNPNLNKPKTKNNKVAPVRVEDVELVDSMVDTQESPDKKIRNFEGGDSDKYGSFGRNFEQKKKKSPFLTESNAYVFDYQNQPIDGGSSFHSEQAPPDEESESGSYDERISRTKKTKSTKRQTDADETGFEKDNSNYVLSEGHDDRVVVQDLAGMKDEIGLENLYADDDRPVSSSEVSDELKKLLKTKHKVKSDLYQKNKRILKIEQETVIGVKLCCPASWRPFEAYAVSSNGVFELARLDRDFKCSLFGLNRPELKVYSTQYKYQEINDHFSEQYTGKII